VTAGRVTRGNGLIEAFLAQQRARVANRLIPSSSRNGRILDVGCGTHPWFLLNTAFAERIGLDKIERPVAHPDAYPGIRLISHDLEIDPVLPFQDEYFDVVTMLAVIEHVEPSALPATIREIRRVIRPGGMYILTTPAGWTDGLLRIMARFGLVSREEIEEHKAAYTREELAAILRDAGFKNDSIRLGTFELGMNLWATARK
jgi:2-polyprenyl-3-methyl-5-hydroxy-6-metoxy-1,4-benzoquinol methylase